MASAGGDAVGWWWCVEHARVEQGARCPSLTRLGPYDTAAEAATTLWYRARSREREAREGADQA